METTALLANSMISNRIDYCNSLLYGVNKYNMAQLQRFKMPFVELFSDLIKQAMLLPTCKNYVGSQFHTVSCSNIILNSRLSNSPNPNQIKISSLNLGNIGFLFLLFIPRRPLVGNVLQWLLPLNGTDSHNWFDHRAQS